MQVKTYYSDQFFLSTDVRSMSYCPIYWKVISLPTSKVFNFSLRRRSLQVGNVFKHRQLSFQLISWVFLSSNWSALRMPMFLPCELTCSPTRDTGLEVPLPTGLACSPVCYQCVLPFWGMQSVILSPLSSLDPALPHS